MKKQLKSTEDTAGKLIKYRINDVNNTIEKIEGNMIFGKIKCPHCQSFIMVEVDMTITK